jgi:hypothetical protein
MPLILHSRQGLPPAEGHPIEHKIPSLIRLAFCAVDPEGAEIRACSWFNAPQPVTPHHHEQSGNAPPLATPFH